MEQSKFLEAKKLNNEILLLKEIISKINTSDICVRWSEPKKRYTYNDCISITASSIETEFLETCYKIIPYKEEIKQFLENKLEKLETEFNNL